jgi:hypothetical protein
MVWLGQHVHGSCARRSIPPRRGLVTAIYEEGEEGAGLQCPGEKTPAVTLCFVAHQAMDNRGCDVSTRKPGVCAPLQAVTSFRVAMQRLSDEAPAFTPGRGSFALLVAGFSPPRLSPWRALRDGPAVF